MVKIGDSVKIKRAKNNYYKEYYGVDEISQYVFTVLKTISHGPGDITTHVLFCKDVNSHTGRGQFYHEHTVYADSSDFKIIKEDHKQLSIFEEEANDRKIKSKERWAKQWNKKEK